MLYCFATCQLDTDSRVLLRDGQPVHVEPQVFDLLTIFVQASGKLVSKEELIETVWRGLNVSDATIAARLSAARAAVGDDGKTQAVIRTVPKRGFRLIAELCDDAAAPTPTPTLAPMTRPEPCPPIRFTPSFDGQPIAYAKHGDGPPLMRVGHWLSHLELDWHCPVWRPLLSRLAGVFTLHRFDLRGTGLSTRNTDRLTLDAFANDLLAVADAAGLDRFPIFAASQAVPIAIRFAAQHPERVSRMVLYGGYATGRVFRETEAGQVDEDTVLSLIRGGWGQREGPFMKAFTTLFMPDATPEQINSIVRTQAGTISAEGAAKLRVAVDRFRVEEDLARVTAPVLVLHTQDDAIHPISQGQYLAAHLPDAEFQMLSSRNHAPLPQDPAWQVLVDAICTFCQRG